MVKSAQEGLRSCRSLAAARETIRRVETTTTYIPDDEIEVRKAIENAYQRFKEIDN